MIEVDHLVRTFDITVRPPGLRGALRSVVHRESRTITAVDDIGFRVGAGEIVGFLGPNGAGKTTTLKCIAGLLTTTSGRVRVLGYDPAARDSEFLRRIGFVMGQRWQLHVDLPVWESFDLHRVIYRLGKQEFADTRDQLVEMLGLGPYVMQQARRLSLGQRMRCEFAAALLHRPAVVLLDEPTLGLDFEAQQQIRTFIAEYVAQTQASVLLTSHYLRDIEVLCGRVLTISDGRLTFSGSLAEIRATAGRDKRVRVRFVQPLTDGQVAELGALTGVTVVEVSRSQIVLEAAPGAIGRAVDTVERWVAVEDVDVAEQPLEDALTRLYHGGRP
ncbi:ABC transporter ATP-binding protein [Cellulomonas taurus]|uniref:ABC transporter ATP-binding protein n=1 Tax=Cellulomonas taurus TaxID=2729175 RepID=UPI00145E054E|nr:ATP-binding cassette domain-containing protein [Cellulomonas taurus]